MNWETLSIRNNLGVIPPPRDTSCRFFTETGFQVCYAFLDFFDAYGGIDRSVTRFLTWNSDMFLVQYFQFARLEWHGAAVGQQVSLTDVGAVFTVRRPVA
jgi:hypothetical protein